jgi:rhamnose utilization protein RhaD (predicted bifunctional aldolase and dehydrogenase)
MYYRTNNAGDLVTKEGTQETAVTLIGLILGMICAQSIATNPQHAMALFLFLTGVHVWANYQAVYALHVESINPARGYLLTKNNLLIHQAAVDKSKSIEKDFSSLLTKSAQFSISHVCAIQ